jgi:hypothetical protein
MRITRSPAVVLGIASLVVLGACAAPPPPPAPILAEPVYDKYGNPVPECRPADRPVSTQYPQRLPICEQECEDGLVAVTGAQGRICVPRGPDDGPNGRTTPGTAQ